jgi:predicted nucleic acid-binding protein
MNRKDLDAARILLEEKAARETAKSLGLPLTGFIGVLLRACRDSLLTPDEMRTLLADCRRQGTRYSDELIAEMHHRCQEVKQK